METCKVCNNDYPDNSLHICPITRMAVAGMDDIVLEFPNGTDVLVLNKALGVLMDWTVNIIQENKK